MPTISIKRDLLFQSLGRTYTDEEFRDLCFQFGIELDGVTSEKKMKEKMHKQQLQKEPSGSSEKEKQKKPAAKAADTSEDAVIYRIDIPANRYDLLCLEGLSSALKVFIGNGAIPDFRTITPAAPLTLHVDSSVSTVRPFIAAAVLRNVTFTPDSYASFIDLQDKLHQNICRKRTLVSIGTHDLDTIEGPFHYKALPPADIKFAPLDCTEVETAVELFDRIRKAEQNHLKKFLHIIEKSPLYPVVLDSKDRVMSLPPIINGDHSKIKLSTKNIFIEATATDLTKLSIVLNIMVTMFSVYCAEPFTVEVVEVVGADGKITVWPDLSVREELASVEYINRAIGVSLTPQQMVDMLNRMSLKSKLSEDHKNIIVSVPPTRSDVMHACDIMEDVAIGYGFNNLVKNMPATVTVGKQQPLNLLTDLLRHEVAQNGFSELLTLSLCSHKENFEFLNQKDDGTTAVVLANPKTIEFEVGRTSLLPGVLKTIAHNKKVPLPLKVFEISDVILKNPASDVGASNKRMLCAAYYSNLSSGFEIIHGLLDRLMLVLKVSNKLWAPPVLNEDSDDEDEAPAAKGAKGKPKAKKEEKYVPTKPYYHIAPSEDPTFFPGRRADIILNDTQKIGVMGILHPQVLKNFGLPYPASVLTLEVEHFA